MFGHSSCRSAPVLHERRLQLQGSIDIKVAVMALRKLWVTQFLTHWETPHQHAECREADHQDQSLPAGRADMDNYMMYNGTDGVYTHTVKYERDDADPACSAGTAVPVTPELTLQQVRTASLSGSRLCAAHPCHAGPASGQVAACGGRAAPHMRYPAQVLPAHTCTNAAALASHLHSASGSSKSHLNDLHDWV